MEVRSGCLNVFVHMYRCMMFLVLRLALLRLKAPARLRARRKESENQRLICVTCAYRACTHLYVAANERVRASFGIPLRRHAAYRNCTELHTTGAQQRKPVFYVPAETTLSSPLGQAWAANSREIAENVFSPFFRVVYKMSWERFSW